MLSNLLDAKLVWMPLFCYIPNYNLQNVVHMYLLHRIGRLLACEADVFKPVLEYSQENVAQLRRQGTLNIQIVGSNQPQRKI